MSCRARGQDVMASRGPTGEKAEDGAMLTVPNVTIRACHG
jgi:hypothetical protein